jgi:hypothetical protein
MVPEIITATNSRSLPILFYVFATLFPRAEPSGKSLGRNSGKIFKNYALKSMDEVYAKLEDAALYIERNPALVKSITSFPYITKSL